MRGDRDGPEADGGVYLVGMPYSRGPSDDFEPASSASSDTTIHRSVECGCELGLTSVPRAPTGTGWRTGVLASASTGRGNFAGPVRTVGYRVVRPASPQDLARPGRLELPHPAPAVGTLSTELRARYRVKEAHPALVA